MHVLTQKKSKNIKTDDWEVQAMFQIFFSQVPIVFNESITSDSMYAIVTITCMKDLSNVNEWGELFDINISQSKVYHGGGA